MSEQCIVNLVKLLIFPCYCVTSLSYRSSDTGLLAAALFLVTYCITCFILMCWFVQGVSAKANHVKQRFCVFIFVTFYVFNVFFNVLKNKK